MTYKTPLPAVYPLSDISSNTLIAIITYTNAVFKLVLRHASVKNLEHSFIDFNGYDLLRSFQKLQCQISGAGSDLQDRIGRKYGRFSNNRVQYSLVRKNVLASALIEIQTGFFVLIFLSNIFVCAMVSEVVLISGC